MSLTVSLPPPEETTSTSRTSEGQVQAGQLSSLVQSPWTAVLGLALLCGALFFYGLNIGELYRTESLRAVIGREFLRSGDWIVPTLYGEPLLTKPPGMYAAIAAASWLKGEVTEWTARLPSALAATAIVFLFYWYASRQVGRCGGLIAAALTPCTLLWLDKAAAAEIDMLQVFWVAAALLFFLRAVEERASVLWWLLALLCVAGGVLTKWTAGVFFYAAVIPFLLWRGRLRLLFSWQHLLGAALGAGVCIAWVGAVVHQVGWEVFRTTVEAEAMPRISHAHHLGDKQLLETILHPLQLWAVNLPWSAFALVTLWPGFFSLWDERGRRLVQAFHCWTWPNILVWTLLPDHATRHSFPLFPGITGLAAMAWIAYATGRLPQRLARWFGRFAVLSLAVFGVSILGGVGAGIWFLPTQAWWLLMIVLGMAAWCVQEGCRAYRERQSGHLLLSMILTWVVLKFAFVQLYIPIRNGGREPRARADVLAQAVPPGRPLHLVSLKDDGILFYYDRPVIRLSNWKQLPLGREPVYGIANALEWQQLQKRRDWQLILQLPLKDQQGDEMVLFGGVQGDPPILQAFWLHH